MQMGVGAAAGPEGPCPVHDRPCTDSPNPLATPGTGQHVLIHGIAFSLPCCHRKLPLYCIRDDCDRSWKRLVTCSLVLLDILQWDNRNR